MQCLFETIELDLLRTTTCTVQTSLKKISELMTTKDTTLPYGRTEKWTGIMLRDVSYLLQRHKASVRNWSSWFRRKVRSPWDLAKVTANWSQIRCLQSHPRRRIHQQVDKWTQLMHIPKVSSYHTFQHSKTMITSTFQLKLSIWATVIKPLKKQLLSLSQRKKELKRGTINSDLRIYYF